MQNEEPIRCRMAACREALNDGKEWSFYLINDNLIAFDLVVLYAIGYEWGDIGKSETADVRTSGLAPGAHALLWRDDGTGAELRMELKVRVHACDSEVRMQFEFPKLYRQHNLQIVEGLGKPGWQVPAEGKAKAEDGSKSH